MILDPAAFTHEHLSNLKFKELQKLSAQFRVNKRWAKKQELIENLLAIKPAESSNAKNENFEPEKHDEKEWRDGSTVFQNLSTSENNSNVFDRRLTFNVDKTDKSDFRLTFDVPPKEASIFLTTANNESSLRRDTYDVSSKVINIDWDEVKDSRGTYEVPQKEILIINEDIPDSRATYDVPQKHEQLFKGIQEKLNGQTDEGMKSSVKSSITVNLTGHSVEQCQRPDIKFGAPALSGAEKKNKTDTSGPSKIKMLTIPYLKVPRRTKRDLDESKCHDPLMKVSMKSIAIKKSRLPDNLDLLKSPNSMRRTLNRKPSKQDLAKLQATKLLPTRIPIISKSIEKKHLKPDVYKAKEMIDKENLNTRLKRRKSKTADEVLLKNPSCSSKVNFMSPPISNNKNQKVLPMPSKRTPLKKANEDLPAKPLTARKMPDFNRIHQKQFEQMDSLHDYLKKREERTRKLFGTPQEKNVNFTSSHQQQPHPMLCSRCSRHEFDFKFQAINNTALFTFQSNAAVKSNVKFGSSKSRENSSIKMLQREAVKNKLPPSKLQIDAKNKNRSHINGVRTNKRFELQMKLRNM